MLRVAAFALAAFTLSACASPPPLQLSLTDVQPAAHTLEAQVSTIVVERDAKAAKNAVQAPELLYPLWKESLSSALSQTHTFSGAGARKLKIAVTVIKVDAPEFGIEMVTTASARYDVSDATTGEMLFSRTVDTRGVVPGDYAFMGMIRAQESVNRSVRNNISDFLKQLQDPALAAKLAGPSVS